MSMGHSCSQAFARHLNPVPLGNGERHSTGRVNLPAGGVHRVTRRLVSATAAARGEGVGLRSWRPGGGAARRLALRGRGARSLLSDSFSTDPTRDGDSPRSQSATEVDSETWRGRHGEHEREECSNEEGGAHGPEGDCDGRRKQRVGWRRTQKINFETGLNKENSKFIPLLLLPCPPG